MRAHDSDADSIVYRLQLMSFAHGFFARVRTHYRLSKSKVTKVIHFQIHFYQNSILFSWNILRIVQQLSILVECSSSTYKHLRLHPAFKLCAWTVVLTTCQDVGRGLWEDFLGTSNRLVPWPRNKATLHATLHFCQSDMKRELCWRFLLRDCSSGLFESVSEAELQLETRTDCQVSIS